MNWLEPWVAVTDSEQQRLLAELYREVSAGHMLHGVPLTVAGRSLATDDVLVQRLDGSPYFVVHLSWQPESSMAWPRTEQYAT